MQPPYMCGGRPLAVAHAVVSCDTTVCSALRWKQRWASTHHRLDPAQTLLPVPEPSCLQLALNAIDYCLLAAADEAVAAGELGTATPSEQQLASDVRQAAAAMRSALAEHQRAQGNASKLVCFTDRVMPAALQLAAALLAWWRRPEQQAEAALEVAQAAAARSCAYLRCSNLVAEGGPAAGQGEGSMRCR